MRINSFKTKNGQDVLLNHKITVFVGPNNSGKSQTLQDIQYKLEGNQSYKPVIIKDYNFQLPLNESELKLNIGFKDSIYNVEHYTIEGIQSDLLSKYNVELSKYQFYQLTQSHSEEIFYQHFGKFFVASLNSSTRLKLVEQVQAFVPQEEYPSNLLQSLYVKTELEPILSKAFKEAFNMDLKLDYSELMRFCLRVSSNMPLIPEDARDALAVTRNIPKIDNQGDGFKSFTGIILGLLMSQNRIILLDEPEAFLHPAQARFLGKWIGDNIDKFNSQILICTHNSNFLSGILSSDNAVDIYRLNRSQDITEYNLLPAIATEKLYKNPLLSSQRVIEAIFHKGVVVCEADADRAIYQSVASVELSSNQEVLFIHSHNKQTLKDVADILIGINIPVALIADIDILNSKDDLSKIIDTLNIENKSELLITQKRIADAVSEISDEIVIEKVKEQLQILITQIEGREHSLSGLKGAYNRVEDEFKKWKEVKEKGIIGMPESVREEAERLILKLNTKGLFIVPVGELESWIELGIKKKNKWIIPALNRIYNKETPEALKKFISEIVSYLLGNK